LKLEKKHVDMLGGNLYREIIVFAVPIMASGFLQLLYNAADLVVIGKYVGGNLLGAVGAASPLNMLIINFFVGFSSGVSVVVSTGLGEDNWKKVNRAVHAALPLAVAFGTFVAVLGLFVIEPILVAMGTPEDILPYSVKYAKILFLGCPANLIYNYGAAILKANGDTKRPLYYLTFSGAMNVIMNIFFVTVFHMTVDGVALATVLANCISAFLTVRRLTQLTNCCRLQFKYMRFYTHACLRILKIGIPAGLQNSMFSFSNMIIQRFINAFGTAVVSGATAAQSLNGFQQMVLNGVAQANVNFAGQNYGAQKYDRVRKTYKISLLYTTIIAAFSATFILIFIEPLLGIYIKDSPEAIAAGAVRLTICAIFTILNVYFDCTSGILRGIGSSLVPSLISITCICGIRLAYIYLVYEKVPMFHTLQGLYLCYPVSWGSAVIVGFIAYIFISKKRFAYHDAHMAEFRKDTFRDPRSQN